MTINKYRLTVKHDNGTIRIITAAARERQQDRARAIYTRLYKLAFYRQYPDHIDSQKFNNLKNKTA